MMWDTHETVRERFARAGVLDLAERIAREHRVSFDGVFVAKSRHPAPARARRRWIALVRWSTDLSSNEIGQLLGTDHSTVLTAVKVREVELARLYPSLRRPEVA